MYILGRFLFKDGIMMVLADDVRSKTFQFICISYDGDGAAGTSIKVVGYYSNLDRVQFF